MKELMEYREKLLIRLREAAAEFCELCKSFKDPFLKTEGDWTIHQFAFHVRGIDRDVYGMRIRRTMNEENPVFKSLDPDAWMVASYSNSESMEKILGEFLEGITELTSHLQKATQDVWSRLSEHETMGKELTLQLWVERSLAHIEEHLTGLKKAQNQ